MVVVVEPGIAQPFGLARLQQAQRRAGLQPQRLDAADHRNDRHEVALGRPAPCSPHAEPGGAGGLGLACCRQHRVQVHHTRGRNIGIETGALRAIGAVLRAAAGLDAQQGGNLDPVGIEVAAVNRMGLGQQVVERPGEEHKRAFAGPSRPVGKGSRTWTGTIGSRNPARQPGCVRGAAMRGSLPIHAIA